MERQAFEKMEDMGLWVKATVHKWPYLQFKPLEFDKTQIEGAFYHPQNHW